jgi:hypothetical protein
VYLRVGLDGLEQRKFLTLLGLELRHTLKDTWNLGSAGFKLGEALSYLRYGALFKFRYSMSVTNMIFGYLEG